MKIIQPKVELWRQGEDIKAHVARCARICYKRETGNDEATYMRLINSHHWSMFRHETVYAMVPKTAWQGAFGMAINKYTESPYIKWITCDDYIYVATNGNFMLDREKDNPVLWKYIHNNRVSEVEFNSCQAAFENLARWTFCVDTQISTSRELNRVSPNNIAEQSTRYVYEDGTICKPHWMSDEIATHFNEEPLFADWINDNIEHQKAYLYISSCNDSFINYKTLVDEFGMNRQDARGVLPIDTATRCAYTYSILEWRAILNLRYYGTTGAPHPNAKIIAGMIRQELIKLGYAFR